MEMVGLSPGFMLPESSVQFTACSIPQQGVISPSALLSGVLPEKMPPKNQAGRTPIGFGSIGVEWLCPAAFLLQCMKRYKFPIQTPPLYDGQRTTDYGH